MLDSTDPDAVRAVPVEGSLFAIASKSGSTMEPNCFADAFWGKTGGDGSRFVAITDPGSALEERARSDGWAHIAHGRADVGGRYSALTAFGLVPAALAGIDIAPLLQRASETLAKCHDEWGVNPGQTLAHVIAGQHAKGRDKLTFVMPPALACIGLWLEQLIAESTGKQGTGVLPVAGEPLGEPSAYGDDRLFIHLHQGYDHDEQDDTLDALRAAGHPVFTLQFDKPADLGALFVEWEVATALVGARAAHQPVRPAERAGGQGPHGRDPRRLRAGRQAARRGGGIARRRARARRARALVRLPAGLRRPDARAPGAARPACRAGCATRSAAPSPRASARATCTRPASTTRAGRRRASSSSCSRASRTTRRFPGGRSASARCATRRRSATRARCAAAGCRVARISLAACEAAIERALEHIAKTRTST